MSFEHLGGFCFKVLSKIAGNVDMGISHYHVWYKFCKNLPRNG